MSRHSVVLDGYEVVVGWDPPLGTFFGQVYRIPERDDDPLVWVGVSPPILSVEDLRKALGDWSEALDERLVFRLEREANE